MTNSKRQRKKKANPIYRHGDKISGTIDKHGDVKQEKGKKKLDGGHCSRLIDRTSSQINLYTHLADSAP